MKAPFRSLGSTSQSIIEPVTHQSPEPVGAAAAFENNSLARNASAAGELLASLNPYSVASEASGDPIPYNGVERRKQNRRRNELPTTLDTRKGKDRRRQGRIDFKI